jgi:acyl dehydratase
VRFHERLADDEDEEPAMPNPLPRACKTLDDIKVGDTFRLTYSISDSDLQKFAELSGDFNPAHFNDEYAEGTVFKNRIAHGMISVAKFSGIFGMDLPGLGAIWGAQTLKFLAPVQLNQPYTAVAQAKEKGEKNVVFSCWVEDKDGARMLEGEATLYPIPQKVRDKLDASGELATLLA